MPEERLWSLMAACDVCVNLRFPTMGETSGSVIRVLSLGKPVVVSDVGWFSELPDGVALKVPVDEHESRTLEAALELLCEPAARAAMGRAAVEHVRREHDLGRCADLYAAALEEAAGREAVGDAVLARGGGRRGGRRARRAGARRARRADPRGGRSHDRARPRCVSGRRRPRRARRGRGSPGSSSVSAAVRFALARRMVAPWIMVDELIYSELAKSFAGERRVPRPRRADGRLRLRLPAAGRPGVPALRRGAGRVRRGQGDQRGRCSRSRPCRRTCSRGGSSRRRSRSSRRVLALAVPVCALRGDADDRERVLPADGAASRSCSCGARAADGVARRSRCWPSSRSRS